MKNAVLYARYSSNMQTENSIEAQKLAIYGYAKDNSFKIITEYIDRAKSGTTVAKRDEFNRMLAESAEGEFDYVIVHKFDRFARNRNDSRASKKILEENGVKVISVLEPISDNPEGIIMEGLAETMSEYYSANLSREVKKGFNVRALKCQNNGGRPPLGYMVDRETETFIINENEAVIVRLIFDLYTKGYSYGYILNELNARGYKTRLGNPFAKNSLHDLIKNKKYCGYYIFNRRMSKKFGKVNSHKNRPQEEIIEIKGGIPAIIGEETYNKAMAIMETHKRSPAQNCAKHIYLLSGLVTCGHCGEIMHGNTHTNVKGSIFHSYRCEKKCDKACPNLEISQERLDDYVLKILEENIFNECIFATLIKSLKESHSKSVRNYSREVEQLKARLPNLETRKQNIIKAISNGFIAEDFKEELSQIELEREQIQLRLSEIHENIPSMQLDEQKLSELLSEFRESVHDRNIAECKQFVREFVDSVIVYNSRIEVVMKISSHIIDGCDYTVSKSINRQFLPNPNKKTAG